MLSHGAAASTRLESPGSGYSLSKRKHDLVSPRSPANSSNFEGVRYVCQRCKKGIQMDGSLEELDEKLLSQVDTENISSEAKKNMILQKLFELAAEATQFDHPFCYDCANQVSVELNKKVQELEQENERYNLYLLKLESEMQSLEDMSELENDIKQVNTIIIIFLNISK